MKTLHHVTQVTAAAMLAGLFVFLTFAFAATPPAHAGPYCKSTGVCGRWSLSSKSTSGVTIYGGWTFYNSKAGKPVGPGKYLGPGWSSDPLFKDTDGGCVPPGKKAVGTVTLRRVGPDKVSKITFTGCRKFEDREWVRVKISKR